MTHILVAGGTGSGKSILMRLILLQAMKKKALVFVGDFKGALDYGNQEWSKQINLITDKEEWSNTLENLIDVLNERIAVFREKDCSNISEYNARNEPIPYIIICCDEVCELLDKSGLQSKDPEKIMIEKIEKSLRTIARIGRSVGISLLLATQSPNRDILSGQIISNMNLKILGKADNTLSLMVLGNADADKKIPKDKNGFFLTNTGILFKGYYVDKKNLNDIVEGVDVLSKEKYRFGKKQI